MQHMNSLEVTFIYAYPLDVGRRRLFEEKSLGTYPSLKEVRETARRWEGLWKEVNKDNRVMEKVAEVSHRVPTRALECFVFGGGLNPMSTPFLMPVMARGGSMRTDENFVQTMIHELLHIFVTTDTDSYWTMVREKYASETPLTQNHIVIFAMLARVYQDLFGHMPPDFSKEDLPEGYAQAIKIVKEAGYGQVIAEYDVLTQ